MQARVLEQSTIKQNTHSKHNDAGLKVSRPKRISSDWLT